jgi:hypothetical protein
MAKPRQPKKTMGTLVDVAEMFVESFKRLPLKESTRLRAQWLADAGRQRAESKRKTSTGEWVE